MSLPDFSKRQADGTVPFRIRGGDLATVEFNMATGDMIFAQPGTLVCASGGVKIDINWGTGLLDPIRRSWAGEKMVLQEITSEAAVSRAVFGAALPGRIVHVRLNGNNSIFCERGAYIAHSGDIKISIGLARRFRAGFFGGQGFVMQRLSGRGDVFLHALGSIIDWTLEQEAVAVVNTRNLLFFDGTVSYDIQFAGGLWATLLGGHGLFLARLKGPGRMVAHSIDQAALKKAVTGRTPKEAEAARKAQARKAK